VAWALITILALPLAAVTVSALDGWRLARASTVVAGAASFGLAVALALHVSDGAMVHAAGGWLRLDSVGAVFLVATGLLYALAAVFSIGYLAAQERTVGFAGFARRYFALLNLFGLSMLLVPLASDFGTLWVAVELTTIVSALMVAIDRTDAALEASWKYVLIASSGLGIALLSIILLYAAGTAALGDAYVPRFDRLIDVAGGLSDGSVKLAFLLAVVGFGTKVGFVPMHTWLPDAHSEAPAPVSALLSGSLLAAALYAILRFFQVTVAAGDGPFARQVLVIFGAISLVAASLFVLHQRNFKRLLAYSSIEHMGVIALGIGFGAPLAVAGALLHVITGAGTLAPYSGPLFLAAALALSGLPLSGVFRSEFQIVAGGFAQPAYVGVALLIVFVNIAFFGVVWHAARMVLSPAPAGESPHEVSVWMVGAMLACLVVVVGLGVHVPGDLTRLLSDASQKLVHPGS
jgi:hydrogenase-4 component F